MTGDLDRLQEEGRARNGTVPAMLPATAYTSDEVLAWERRHLYAGTWTCLGRLDELLPDDLEGRPATQRAVMVGDVSALLTRNRDGAGERLRMFANTCRHRAHELLPEDDASARHSVICPYHAWSYDLAGDLVAAPGYRDEPGFDAAAYSLVELPVETWQGWFFGHALHPLGHPDVVPFADHLGELDGVLAPYRPAGLRLAARHTYEIAANWKIVAENYPACVRRQLRPARSLGRRLDGAARRHGHDVADGGVGRSPDPGGLADRGGVRPPAAEPPRLRPSRLRDDPPAGAAGARPHLDRVLLVPPARRRRHAAGPDVRRGVLGPHQPPGLGRLRVRPARPAEPALRAGPAVAERGRGGALRGAGVAGVRRAAAARRPADRLTAYPRRVVPNGPSGPSSYGVDPPNVG